MLLCFLTAQEELECSSEASHSITSECVHSLVFLGYSAQQNGNSPERATLPYSVRCITARFLGALLNKSDTASFCFAGFAFFNAVLDVALSELCIVLADKR